MSVLDQAQNVGGIVSAARLRERWQRKEANAGDGEYREQLREAIADLEARFPELEDVPPGGAEAFAKERGHGSKSRSPVHEGRRRAASGKRRASTTTRSKASSGSAPDAPAPSPGPIGLDPTRRRERRGGRSRLGPRTQRLYRQTGIPQGIESGTSVTMSLLGGTVGLSILYLLLSSAEQRGSGGYALPRLLSAVTNFLHRFISTQDILGGGPAPAEPVTYSQRVLAGEVAGPPNLPGMLPQLGSLPHQSPGVRTNPDLPAQVRSLPPIGKLPPLKRHR